MRTQRSALTLLVAFLPMACGGSPAAPTPAAPTAANVTITVLTASVVPIPQFGLTPQDADFPSTLVVTYWTAGFVIEVRETAGVGCSQERMEVTWRDRNGQSIGSTVSTIISGPHRLAARGRETQEVIARTHGGISPRPSGTITVSIQYIDDLGNEVTGTATATVP